MGKWIGQARYADGKEVQKIIPYTACGIGLLEDEEQHALEMWLVTLHPGCVWVSVTYERDF